MLFHTGEESRTRYIKAAWALCKIGFSAVSQNEFAAVFPQGNGNFPAVPADLILDIAGLYGLANVNVYRSVAGQPVVGAQYRTCAADSHRYD